MAGIYLHIPFCKQACHYCNFHFSTTLHRKGEMVDAILKELELQRAYLGGAPLESIYFGGGTPSLLSASELEQLFEKIYALHLVDSDAEITLEANPDDLDLDKLNALRQTPVNRLSIGVQSFFEADLQFMHRAHQAKQAFDCIEQALSVGFNNLTVDLIYGAETTSDAQWAFNIQTLIDFGIPHISAYCLTVEPRTALGHFVATGKVSPVDEEKAARQFELLVDRLTSAGFEHYEISNFARPGCYARHNTSYWLGAPYLGVGPSAHSFDGGSRQWNIANNTTYMKRIAAAAPLESPWFEREELHPEQRYHEQLMTSLRTIWGFDPNAVDPAFRDHFLQHVQPFLEQGLITQQHGKYILSRAGKLLADRITMELF